MPGCSVSSSWYSPSRNCRSYLALASLIPVTAPTNVFLAFVIIVMSASAGTQMSREVRGKTLALARIEYVRAAIAIGATTGASYSSTSSRSDEPRHRRGDARHPAGGAARIVPRFLALRSSRR